MDPQSVIDTAAGLENILAMTEEQVEQVTRELRSENRDVMRETVQPPELTEEQIHAAQSVIPNDYWQLNCWSCRESGHSTFTCPLLTPSQRIFFAYKYYLHQVEANPLLKGWYKQKLNAMRQAGPDPGPRPPTQQYDGRGGRGRGGFPRGGFNRGGFRQMNNAARDSNRHDRPGNVHILQANQDPTPPSDTLDSVSGN